MFLSVNVLTKKYLSSTECHGIDQDLVDLFLHKSFLSTGCIENS